MTKTIKTPSQNWNLVEYFLKLNKQTKRKIEQARADIKAGRFYTHEQVKNMILNYVQNISEK